MRILVSAASKPGFTAQIAMRIGEALRSALPSDAVVQGGNASEVSDATPYDAGIAGPVPYTTAGPWLWLSVAAATIAAAGNIAALAGVSDVYGRETASFVNQALAQDIISLTVVCPAIVVSALLAGRGSMTAYLLWLGAMSFTVYNYVIYTLSIHAGALFLPWVAVLGLSLFALTGGLAALDWHAVKTRFDAAPRRTAGWFLIVVAVLFTGLWLKDIIPALLSGQTPAGARDLGLPSSPVHVLDLAFYLPATFAAGLGLLRDRKLGYAIAPALLIFLALTALPIMLTPFIANARGHTPGWAILAPMTAITVASLTIVIRLLSAAPKPRHPLPHTAVSHDHDCTRCGNGDAALDPTGSGRSLHPPQRQDV